jgi:hypothetical protein
MIMPALCQRGRLRLAWTVGAPFFHDVVMDSQLGPIH